MASSRLCLIRDRLTVTSPKVVLKANGRVPRCGDTSAGFAVAVRRTSSWSAFSIRAWRAVLIEGRPDGRTPRSGREGRRRTTARRDIPSDSCSEKAVSSLWTGPRLMVV